MQTASADERAANHAAARRAAIEYALTGWARQQREQDATRDDLVRGAVAAGISKHRVHVLMGIARTTIDRILRTDEADAAGGAS